MGRLTAAARWRWLALGLTLVLLRPALLAQQPPANQPTLRIGVTAVEIDAVVTDRDGKHIANLQAGDFELFQDDKLQVITSFRFVPARSRAEREAAETPGRPAPLRRDQANRILAVVIDDLSLNRDDMEHTRLALNSFVDRDLRADDAVAIVTTSRGVGRLQQFTNDKAVLKAAIERLRASIQVQSFAGSEIDALNADEMDASAAGAHADAAEHAQTAADYVDELQRAGSLNAVQNVVRGMRDLPERKSVLFVNDGFAMVSNSGKFAYRRPVLLEAFSKLVDEANRSFVVIHTLDGRGVTNPLGSVFNADNRNSPASRPNFSMLTDAQRASQEGPMLLARLGGGLAFGGNDLRDGFAKAIADQEGYYLLGYEPAADTFRRPGDTQLTFHNVRVRVKKDGLRARARSGFFNLTDEEAHPEPKTAEDRLWAVASSPFLANDLGVHVTPLFAHMPEGDTLHVLVRIDGQGLSFAKGPDGQYRAPIELLSALVDDRGAVMQSTLYKFTLSAAGEPNDAQREAGFTTGIDVPAQRPGTYQLRLAVRDVASNRSGNGYQLVRIPKLSNGRLALSGIALQPGAGGATQRYAVEIYNAQRDPTSHAPSLTLRSRIYRDGALIAESKPAPLDARPKPDDPARTATATGEVALPSGSKAGDYQLELEVTDLRARKSSATAHQWVEFSFGGKF